LKQICLQLLESIKNVLPENASSALKMLFYCKYRLAAGSSPFTGDWHFMHLLPNFFTIPSAEY